MEKYKCRLCFRSFINGRALGGHMRSHMMKMNHPKPERFRARETASFSSSSSSSEEKAPNLSYGLRENPKRSIRLVDHEFSFAGEDGSVIVQDRESETESSKNPTGAPLLLSRKERVKQIEEEEEEGRKRKLRKPSYPDSLTGSLISETITDEDLAFCLMMLSEDNWIEKTQNFEDEEEEDQSFEENDEFEKVHDSLTNKTRGKYKCETCNKVFGSYQALGGHRASHKKNKFAPLILRRETEQENAGALMAAEERTHECPVCFRSFSSGQALGGHKRSHGAPAKHPAKVKNSLLDLNMPAPMEEEDEISQIELSALSDAEFSFQR